MQEPQLAELLRTCVHPPSLLLRIVHVELLDVESPHDESNTSLSVDSTSAPEVARRYALKYILSDGEIMMQALLHRKLLRDTADVVVGDLLDIRHFTIKKSRRSEGHGHVVYLAVEDCHFLQQVRSTARTSIKEEEAIQNTGTRKRKRTLSHGETGIARGGAFLNTEMNEVPHGVVEPLPEKQQTVRKISEDALSEIVDRDMANPIGAADLRQPGHNKTSNTQSRNNSMATANPQEYHESRSTLPVKGKPHQRDRSDILRSTFGARQIMSDDDDDDDDNFFEALPTKQSTVKQRRRALQRLDGNTSFGSQLSQETEKPESDGAELFTPSKPPAMPSEPPIPAPIPQMLPPYPPVPKKSVRDGTFALSQTPTFYLPVPPPITTKPQPPPRQAQTQPIPQAPTQPVLLPSPPFHTLASLRNPTPSQHVPPKSYTLTTLAIISWTGTTTIHRPGSLFPPKRHLKIVDPSLAASRPPSRQAQLQQSGADHTTSSFKGQNSFQDAVTVAVYIDATNFKPAAGTVVLFRGLVMQRLVNGDIILNAYGRLKDQRFEETKIDKKEDTGKGDNAGKSEDDHALDQEQGPYNNHWFITDHSKIRRLGHGSRLDYYLDWWAEKQRGQQPPQN